MTLKTRIHDMIDNVALIRSKTDTEVAFTVRTSPDGITFEIFTLGGHETFSDASSAELWISEVLAAIGEESDPAAARELQEARQYKARMESQVAKLQARIAAL